MDIFIFQSQTRRELRAFAGDRSGNTLPTNLGPWMVTGVVGPGKLPPFRLSRAVIEKAIAEQGFQLWRLKDAAAA